MTRKQKEAKYQKMLAAFDEGHRKLKHLKQDMVKLRNEINQMPVIIDERPDEINLKVV